MSDDEDEVTWVELRRFNDPIEADMARDFLESSGVHVSIRGNSGITGVLNRFNTILDIRLVVPESELATAREALEAMLSPSRNEAPFRGFGHEKEIRAELGDEVDQTPIPEKKSPFSSIGVALMVPIGAGHTYAEHRAAGQVFAIGVIGTSVLAIFAHTTWLWVAVILMVMTDALSSPLAVKRFNAGAVPSIKRQRIWTAVVVVAALLIARTLGD